MSFTPLRWVNDSEPALEADNLNRIEKGIKDAHDEIATLDEDVIALTDRADDTDSSINALGTRISSTESAIATLNTLLQVKTLSFTATTTTGTYVGGNGYQFGKVVFVRFQVRNSASVTSGSNVYQGTISTGLPRPATFATNGSYYGNHAITGSLDAAGNLIVRNASSSAVSITGTSTASVSFAYITN